MIKIVPLYAAALALIFVILTVLVIRLRMAHRISLGAGDSPALERQIRVHANFVEYVPLTLLLLAMAELRGAGAVWLHTLCAILVAARIAHAAGLTAEGGLAPLRSAGFVGTIVALGGGAMLILLT